MDADFFTVPSVVHAGMDGAVRRFVRSWGNGFSLRKPFPGFHPGIYREQCGYTNPEINPLAHYIRAGSPGGPWSYEVIAPSSAKAEVDKRLKPSVALHLHLFYPDLAPIIVERLNANRIRPDLFVSVASNANSHDMEGIVKNYEGKTIDIQAVPNRGRDIGAFLTAFGERITSQYEFIGHFHTKKTLELANREVGTTWFSFLLENLIGGRHRMMDSILEKMTADPSIGLVFPDDPYVEGWSDNLEISRLLASRMGLMEPKNQYFNFPMGTMFWARSSAIRSLIVLNLSWEDYPAEPLPYDGTMLHAIERLLPFIVDAAHYRSVVTNVPGITR
jgi:lipopolysaccharide biosynthesis protein